MLKHNLISSYLISRIPTIGILCFIILYAYSSTLYPGGSQIDLKSEGFDWIYNYWCNLMNEKAMNGALNPARPFAIFAMFLLCASLAIFFIQFANTFCESVYWRRTIMVSGLISMFFATLISTQYHDLMTIVSSFFGLFVVVGIIIAIYKSSLTFYKIAGLLCLILLALNNYIYYTGHFIKTLALIQKLSFFFVLIWIIGLNFKIIKYEKM